MNTKNMEKYRVKNSPASITTLAVTNSMPKIEKITPTSSGEKVKNMQQIFSDMGLYAGDISGIYTDLEPALISYQIESNIITDKNHDAAGYIGPKTTNQLQKDYHTYTQREKDRIAEEKAFKTKLVTSITSMGTLSKWDHNSDVRTLQKTLAVLGYFHEDDTAIFGEITHNALIKYQLEKEIISSPTQQWAGVFGPKTKEYIQKDLYDLFEEKGKAPLSFLAML